MALNAAEQLFLDQARSDYGIYEVLVRKNACHRLHYLQMCIEKLAKAYFWKGGISPGLGHFKFEPFLRALDQNRRDFHTMFGYKDARRFALQKNAVFDLALRLQNLVPAGRNIGPNPEYPWPPTNPTDSPLSYPFPEWADWNETTAGRRLKYFVINLLDNYQKLFP